jgi:phage terminase large subunit GpA-like protein
MAAIDTGYKTSEVYEFCRRFAPRACPVKGKDDLSGEIFRTRKLDKFPNGKPIPEGLVLNVIAVNYLKDKLHRLIHASVDDASQWWIYKGITDDYLTQMTSEDKVIKRNKRTGASSQVWQKKSDSAANHYWDCEVYNVACAEMLHISLLSDKKNHPRIYKGNRSTRGGERKKSWIGNHKNWLN